MGDGSPEYDSPRRRLPLGWLGVLAVGWVLYELTARPMVGVMAVCVKFGWEDFRSAIWLRRRDPWPYRGRTCFWLYLASGLWKTAAAAFLVGVGYFFVFDFMRKMAARPAGPQADLREAILGAVMANAAGLAFAAQALAYALWLARRRQLRLWLGGAAHRARRQDFWPPGLGARPSQNYLMAVLMTVLLVLYMPAVVATTPVMLWLGGLVCRHVGVGLVGLWFVLPVIVGCIGGCIWGVVRCHRWVQRRVAASHPIHCWCMSPPADEGAGDSTGMAAQPFDPLP
jgi:hypothetical protein